jgi:hypothetical protein
MKEIWMNLQLRKGIWIVNEYTIKGIWIMVTANLRYSEES